MNFFLIIGFGSIGKRHLENLMVLGHENIIIVSKSNQKFKNFKTYTNLELSISENLISHAFICSSTASHHESLKILLNNKIENIYLEKPISNNLENLKKITPELLSNCKRLVVGYDLHFDKGLNKIKQIIQDGTLGSIYSLNAIVGQYLPDWRPNQDYKIGMSAKIDEGGGVMLDLVHEFDYIRWLLGQPNKIACFFQNNQELKIETEDVADVLVQFENKISATIHLDYHQKTLIRNCMITCEKATVFWDLPTQEVKINFKNGKSELFKFDNYSRNERYIEILNAFLDNSKFDSRLTTFDDALISLKMVLGAKESSNLNKMITLN
jgi:predicted dehydrogenase